MALLILNGPIIAAGQSVSAPLDCTAGEVVRLTMPGHWEITDAPPVVTFLISSDGILFNDYYNPNGDAVELPLVIGGAFYLPEALRGPIGFLQIRAGRRSQPIVQSIDREFAVALRLP